jgi:hypothetical protein
MPKFQRSNDLWLFHCPGCECGHFINDGWSFNGDVDNPTVSPSILVNVGGKSPSTPVCHSFVRDGKIEFLNDCTHKLAGHTVEIPEWNDA